MEGGATSEGMADEITLPPLLQRTARNKNTRKKETIINEEVEVKLEGNDGSIECHDPNIPVDDHEFMSKEATKQSKRQDPTNKSEFSYSISNKVFKNENKDATAYNEYETEDSLDHTSIQQRIKNNPVGIVSDCYKGSNYYAKFTEKTDSLKGSKAR